MPTVRQLEEAYARRPAGEEEIVPPRPQAELAGEAIAWQMAKDSAPVVTREAVIAMLDEARDTGRWARRTFWVSVAALLVSAVAVAIALLG